MTDGGSTRSILHRSAARRLTPVLLLLLGTAATAAGGNSPGMILEVFLNGARKPSIIVHADPDGAILIDEDTLESLRLVPAQAARAGPPPGMEDRGGRWYRLDALPGVRIELDDSRQALHIEARPEAFRESVLPVAGEPGVPLSPTLSGAYLHYDLRAERGGNNDDTRTVGTVTAGTFVGTTDVLNRSAVRDGTSNDGATRLETRLRHDLPSRMLNVTLGDLQTDPGPVWRSVRLGGIRFRRDFDMRPGFVPYPRPTIRGSAASPSVAELYVEDTRRALQQIPAGPFELTEVPALDGAGNLQLRVEDVLGRSETITVPYYQDTRQLRPGLTDFELALGALREDFGQRSNAYGDPALITSLARGLNTRWTGSAHLEGIAGQWTGYLQLRRVAADFGEIAVGLGGGRTDGRDGHLTRLAYGWRARRGLRLGLDWSRRTPGYRALGDDPLDEDAQARIRLNAGLSLPVLGDLTLVYQRTDPSAIRSRIEIGQASWRTALPLHGSLTLSLLRDFRSQEQLATLMLVLPLGKRQHATASVRDADGERDGEITLARSSPGTGGAGYRLRKFSDGDASAEGRYRGEYGEVAAGVARRDRERFTRVEARGGAASVDGLATLTDGTPGAMAVATTGGVADVPILVDNAVTGRTDDDGRLLITGLRPYEENRISVDPAKLPLTADIGTVQQAVVPPRAGAAAADFRVRETTPVLVRITLADGRPLPRDAAVRQAGEETTLPVGSDGRVFLDANGEQVELQITTEQGSCTITLHIPAGHRGIHRPPVQSCMAGQESLSSR